MKFAFVIMMTLLAANSYADDPAAHLNGPPVDIDSVLRSQEELFPHYQQEHCPLDSVPMSKLNENFKLVTDYSNIESVPADLYYRLADLSAYSSVVKVAKEFQVNNGVAAAILDNTRTAVFQSGEANIIQVNDDGQAPSILLRNPCLGLLKRILPRRDLLESIKKLLDENGESLTIYQIPRVNR